MTEKEFERMRLALLEARNALAQIRMRAHDSRSRGHVCESTKAIDAVHDMAASALLNANKALGYAP